MKKELFVFLCIALGVSAFAKSDSLKKVKYLSDPWYFLNIDSSIRFLDVSKDNKLRSGPRLFEDFTPAVPGAPIVVLPDNKYFFVATYNKLMKFDNQFKIIGEFPLSYFSLKDDIHSFVSPAKASKNSLWITVCEKFPIKNGWSQRFFVLKWEYNLPDKKIHQSPQYVLYCHWGLNQENDVIYIPGESTLVYSYTTNEQKECKWGNYNYADYSKYGLLLSEFPSKENKKIKFISPDNSQETLLVEGSLANWGFNGLVYYCKGSTHLCSVDISGGKKETLFSATKSIQYSKWLTDIDVNNDRNLLSFIYAIPHWWGMDTSSFILVDLKNRSYCGFPDGILGTTSVGWIKQDILSTSQKYAPINIFDAIRDGDKETFDKILLSEINIEQENEYGYTVLDIAVTVENEDFVKSLIYKGANVNAVSSSSGTTPLHASIRCDIKYVELMLKNGANPNVQDNEGRTPLYDAIAINNLQKVILLVQYGAKKDIEAKNGFTPLQLAKKHSLEEIVAYLEKEKSEMANPGSVIKNN